MKVNVFSKALWQADIGVWEHFTFLYELLQQAAPLTAEEVGSGEAAVSTAHTQVGDAFLHQVEGGGKPALSSHEGLASGATNHSPTLQSRWYKTQSRQIERCDWATWAIVHLLYSCGSQILGRDFQKVDLRGREIIIREKNKKTILCHIALGLFLILFLKIILTKQPEKENSLFLTEGK